MSEGDPDAFPALILEHLRAGVAVLESVPLDDYDRNTAGRLAIRLVRLARRTS